MSMVPALAEVLGERLGRPADEMQALIRSSLHEMSKRQWYALTPAQIAERQEAIQRQLRRGVPDITPEDIQQIPLSQLPAFARRSQEIVAKARRAWWAAYKHYEAVQGERERELKRSGLPSAKAAREARHHPRVIAAGERSLELKERLRHLEVIAENARDEMEARIHLVLLC